MGLKKYILGVVVLLTAVFAYTLSILPGEYTLDILDYHFTLPISIWVILPALVLAVASVLHIVFYGLKNYFSLKAVKKDSESIISLINQRLLNQTSTKIFQNKYLKQLGQILGQLDIDVSNVDFSSDSKSINKTVEQILAIKNGKYISSKELKLPFDNPLMIQNLINKVNIDIDFALDVLKNSKKYDFSIIKKAFLKILESKSMTTIKNLVENLELDSDMLIALLKKDSEQNAEFAMRNELILKLMKKVELSNDQLIIIARTYKKTISPEQIIKLYEELTEYKEEYMSAYLFVLAEYEMIDKMRDILENSASHEFIIYKALVDLKDAGKNTYSIDTLQR
jgi:hypothetical protein